MNPNKIIFTDIDGTILFQKEEFGEYYMQDIDYLALAQAFDLAIKLVVSTGRDLQGVAAFLAHCPHKFDYIIANNGAIIGDGDFNIISKTYMDKAILSEIISWTKRHHPDIFITGADEQKCYIFDKKQENSQLDPENKGTEMITSQQFKDDPFPLTMLDMQYPRTMSKIEALKQTQNMLTTLNQKFGAEVNIFRNQAYIDFAAKGISKGSALKQIMSLSSNKGASAIAIGDSWNDVSMFEQDVTSFTFEHAQPEVKGYADHIVENFAGMIAKIS
ncbi:MAG: HAD-IIB family hydrolase [Culicoidibacterales bacterium]